MSAIICEPFCLVLIPLPPLTLMLVLELITILPLSVPIVSVPIALPSIVIELPVAVSVVPVPPMIFLNCKSVPSFCANIKWLLPFCV